ncbi:AMP-binding protein [Erythrobacter sp. NE805]|uniref:AMP-binding protein n=1 Tax=Erythrobacter sp. NE805 TaxID=3389875 RepID=UPI00396B3F77
MTRPPLALALAPFANSADIAAFAATPIEERIAVSSTYALIEAAAAAWPDAPAITFLPRGLASDVPASLSFAALARRVTAVANLFVELGVGRSDGVAVLLPTMPDAFTAIWAASAVGVAVPVNPLLRPDHMVEIMRAARVKVVVSVGPEIDADLAEGASRIAEAVGARLVIALGSAPAGAVDLEAAMAAQPDNVLSVPRPTLDDIASIFHTGGTTARPKLVAHTHRNQLVCAVQVASGSDLAPGDVLLSALPTNHVIAGIATGLTVIATGAHMLIPGLAGFRNPYLLQDFWKIVARHRVSGFSAVPTVLTALMGVPVDADIASLRYVSCGAAPMPRALIEGFEAKTGARVFESYGMTEATTIVSSNPRGAPRREGSVGLPAPYIDLRVNADGEILIRGPAVVQGYLGQAAVADADGWFPTGDLGRLDEDGYLFLTGRAKDLIIRSGHNIDPRMIEDALQSHPAVALAAAVGRPDGYAGEVPVAFVTLREGAEVAEAELERHARDYVAERPAAPATVTILPAMPLTLLGKIFKPRLRLLASAVALQSVLDGLQGLSGGTARARAPDDAEADIVVELSHTATPDDEATILAAARDLQIAVTLARVP